MNLLKPILNTTSSTFRTNLLRSSSTTYKSNFNPLLSKRQMSYTGHVNPWSEPLTKSLPELNIYLAMLPDFKEGSKR